MFDWFKHTTRKDLLWLAVIALAIQTFWALQMAYPAYFDAYYYATNGQRLASGEGFTQLIVWQYLSVPPGLPAPSHTYWMPLSSLLAAVGYTFVDHFRGAQIPFVLLTGTLPLLSYTISSQLSGERWQAVTAALFTAIGGFYAVAWNQPETFAPFAWAGGLCLLALAWAQQRSSAFYWLLSGIMAGLAHLTRADGILFLGIAGLIWLSEIRSSLSGTDKAPQLRFQVARGVLLVAGYLFVMGGWFWRNWLVLGVPLPTVGTQTIFLTTYDDLFAYGRSFHLNDLLSWGWSNILYSRLEGLSLALQTFVAVCGLVFLMPFIVWAWMKLVRQRTKWILLRPMTWYTLALFGVMSLIFTFPGGRGGLFHSTVALWPWFMALAAAGIGLAVDWAAMRLPHWQPERAKRIFSALFVVVALVLSLAVGLPRSQQDDTEANVYIRFGAMLPDSAVVMVGNAPGFYYHTGLAAVSVPNEPVEVMLQAAARYGVTYLVLDMDHPQPLSKLYAGELSEPRIQPLQANGTYRLYRLVGTGD